jgi:predicted enzyme related to lactoylglutathione lyase
MMAGMNISSYFEIPVHELEKAMAFYRAVFGHALERDSVDGNEMAFFPYAEGAPGSSGALAQGDSYVPGKSGARVYFDVPDIQDTLRRAVAAGGAVRYPETAVGAFGFVAELEDLDGNCIGLRAAAASRQDPDAEPALPMPSHGENVS